MTLKTFLHNLRIAKDQRSSLCMFENFPGPCIFYADPQTCGNWEYVGTLFIDYILKNLVFSCSPHSDIVIVLFVVLLNYRIDLNYTTSHLNTVIQTGKIFLFVEM